MPAGARVITTSPAMSVANACPGSTVAPSGLIASAVTLSGAPIDGGCVSTTVMVKLAVAELPELSTAVQCTIVFPSGNVPPDSASHKTDATPEPESVAVAASNVTNAPAGLVASAVRSGETVMTGAIASMGSNCSAMIRSSPAWMLKSACVGVTV